MSTANRQTNEAAAFFYENEAAVKLVEGLLVRAAGILVEQVCSKGLPAGELQSVKQAVEAKDLRQVFRIVRPAALPLRKVDSEGIYWDWVDAFGFYSDAIGSAWPFMTQEKRASALEQSGIAARLICKCIPGEAPVGVSMNMENTQC